MRIVPQAYECILNGYNGIIITSNPSDVFALVFFYIPRLFFFSEKFDKTMVEVQDWCYHRIFTNAYPLYETRSQNVFSSVKSPHFGIQQCHQQDRKVLFKVDHLR